VLTKALGINFHKLYVLITSGSFPHQMAVKGQSHQGSNKLFP